MDELPRRARSPETCDFAPFLRDGSQMASALHWSIREGENRMLETIAVILVVLWLLGMVSGYTIGSFIHLLLVLAVVLFIVRLLTGRRVV
jgi:hypothetical protein